MGRYASCAARIEIELAEVEVDRIAKARAIPEAAGLCLDSLNAAVESFGVCVSDSKHDGVDDPVQVSLDCPGSLLDRLEIRANC